MDGPHIVVQADPGPLAGGLELAEGQEQALQEGVNEADAERRRHRQQKDGEAALDRPAQQPAVHC